MSDTAEALRRLGARIVPCDMCAQIVQAGSHWSVVAWVDGELVDDWGLLACSGAHADLLMRTSPTNDDWRSSTAWYQQAAQAGADVRFSVLSPEDGFWSYPKAVPR